MTRFEGYVTVVLQGTREEDEMPQLTTQRLNQEGVREITDIVNRLAQDDPTWNRFLRRQPSYRYFHIKGSNNQYFWTTEPLIHKGHKRFASGIYRFIKSKQSYRLTHEKYHAKRQDAKARALALYNEATGKEKK